MRTTLKTTLLAGMAALSWCFPAVAQDNPECLGTSCGKPKEEGGGCGCGCGCSVWVAYTDDGKTLAYTDDADGDGKADDQDNCPFAPNRDQLDSDGDAVGDSCDNCKGAANFSQLDSDGDSFGNECDGDKDGDGLPDLADNCSLVPNLSQDNVDGDPLGDACDSDDDGDGVEDGKDNCPRVANANQVLPSDLGLCNVDLDRDNVGDGFDNCPGLANPAQSDLDRDLLGDACDLDIDNDSVANLADNCPGRANRGQLDDDGDLVGDACDSLYCVVVDPANPSDCLNPASPFKVHGGGLLELKRGEKVRLPLFANRNGAAIEYSWTVTRRPQGSAAAIENPKGAVTMSRHWEYAYVDGNVPSFTADADGEYVLQLSGALAFPDRAYPDATRSTSELRLNVGEQGKAQGCSATLFPPEALLGLLLAGLLRRRK